MSTDPPPPRLADAAVYEIHLQGELARVWRPRFADFDVSQVGGVTRLLGEVADQAALHGVLRRVRDAGLPLLRLERHGGGPGEVPSPTIRGEGHAGEG